MKIIPLTQGKQAIVDDADYAELSKHKWYYLNRGYAIRRSGHERVLMHRVLLGAKKGEFCDHKNGDKLDNRRENIRLCTFSQNMMNFGPRKGVKYRGVHNFTSSYRSNRKWQVRIRANGRERVVGYFYSQRMAALTFNRVAKIFHKEFAYQNAI